MLCRDDERGGRDWEERSRYESHGPPRPGHFDDDPRGRAFDGYGAPSRGGAYDFPPPPPPRRPGAERDTYERYERPAERYERPAERYERPAERYDRPAAGYGAPYGGFDDGVIPPPPPPRFGASAQPPAGTAPPEEDEDPERAAFERHLRSLQADLANKARALRPLGVRGCSCAACMALTRMDPACIPQKRADGSGRAGTAGAEPSALPANGLEARRAEDAVAKSEPVCGVGA
jgi:hypothetical protein